MRGEETHTLRAPRGERALFVPPKFACPFMRVVPLNYAMLHTQCVANQPARPPRARIGPHHGSPRHLQGCEGVPGGTVPGGTIGPQFRRTGVPVRRVVFDVGHVCAVAAA
jgi:hypothetical protein